MLTPSLPVCSCAGFQLQICARYTDRYRLWQHRGMLSTEYSDWNIEILESLKTFTLYWVHIFWAAIQDFINSRGFIWLPSLLHFSFLCLWVFVFVYLYLRSCSCANDTGYYQQQRLCLAAPSSTPLFAPPATCQHLKRHCHQCFCPQRLQCHCHQQYPQFSQTIIY